MILSFYHSEIFQSHGNYVKLNDRKSAILHCFASSVGATMAWWLCIRMDRSQFCFFSFATLTANSHLTECRDTKICHLPYQLLPWQQQGSPALARHKCDCASNQSAGHMLVSIVRRLDLFCTFHVEWLQICTCAPAHSETLTFGACCHPFTTKPSVRLNVMCRPQRASAQQMIALCCCLLLLCPSAMGKIRSQQLLLWANIWFAIKLGQSVNRGLKPP